MKFVVFDCFYTVFKNAVQLKFVITEWGSIQFFCEKVTFLSNRKMLVVFTFAFIDMSSTIPPLFLIFFFTLHKFLNLFTFDIVNQIREMRLLYFYNICKNFLYWSFLSRWLSNSRKSGCSYSIDELSKTIVSSSSKLDFSSSSVLLGFSLF